MKLEICWITPSCQPPSPGSPAAEGSISAWAWAAALRAATMLLMLCRDLDARRSTTRNARQNSCRLTSPSPSASIAAPSCRRWSSLKGTPSACTSETKRSMLIFPAPSGSSTPKATLGVPRFLKMAAATVGMSLVTPPDSGAAPAPSPPIFSNTSSKREANSLGSMTLSLSLSRPRISSKICWSLRPMSSCFSMAINSSYSMVPLLSVSNMLKASSTLPAPRALNIFSQMESTTPSAQSADTPAISTRYRSRNLP
mmetsp:Transcript_10678/g.20647  ORF Transcript_10678/g.20647 Transcript_10678/m.20647 type:complete len:255 (-) Transcript_10678:595-1359(-)